MRKPKLIVKLHGGIGNQLFIYCAARRLAEYNHADLIFDIVSGFKNDKKYKRTYQLMHFDVIISDGAFSQENYAPFSFVRVVILRLINLFIPYKNRTYIKQSGDSFDQRILYLSFEKSLYLNGYWQSEKYFKDIEASIRRELVIRPPTDEKNITTAQAILNSSSVAVHVRFFDQYESHYSDAQNNNISKDYYLRAFSEIERRVENPRYFIFSDNKDAAKKLLSFSNRDRTEYILHNNSSEMAFADMWLMSQCKHFIIANSTFSWWGAWLSNNQTKIVITPAIKLDHRKPAKVTSWGFDGLIPEDWLIL